MTPGAGPPMSKEEFRLLRELLLEGAGLVFDESARDRLERRLRERLEATGCRDFTDYYLRLRRPGAQDEFARMLELCLTHETYFFREPRQLRSLEEEILPQLAATAERRPGRRVFRVWSAGCSSGEEPFTLAIILLRSAALRGFELDVMATDVSNAILARARRGVFGPGSFRDVDATLRDRYFRAVGNPAAGQWEVKPEVREVVTFGRVNLWNPAEVAAVGGVDVILCRNVLIYFDREGRRRVVESMFERLRPGGFLLLGHSENLLQASTRFEAVSLAHDLVYRRPLPTACFPGNRTP